MKSATAPAAVLGGVAYYNKGLEAAGSKKYNDQLAMHHHIRNHP